MKPQIGSWRQSSVLLAIAVAATLLNSGCASNGVTQDSPRAANPKPSPSRTIELENLNPGTTEWRISKPANQHEIEGYASQTSVNRGEDISLFVSTPEASYVVQVFRMGWYGGTGARSMTPPTVRSGKQQPMPTPEPETGLIECQWDDPYVLHIPRTPDPNYWASGIYLAKLTAGTSGKESYIIFVVRDDERPSDLLFQSSVATFQAYNHWGGQSLYSRPRAYMVSFNRPYQTRNGAGDFFFWEYHMVQFLEREGYDVTYSTDVDTHARGHLILLHKAFLSVGHDEYWSWQMRKNVEAAQNAGVNLGFFGSNACFWQIRFLPSFLSGDANRTIVCYKSASLDPIAKSPDLSYLTTTQFRRPPVNQPEDALIGVMYESTFAQAQDIVVEDASSWVFENTGLKNGDHLPGLLGHEADRMFGHAPQHTQRIAHSPYLDLDGQRHISDMTVYITESGGTVVATGSLRWNWGLQDFRTANAGVVSLRPEDPALTNAAVQQATRNILGRLGAVRLHDLGEPALRR